jgi:hypothetical protein
MNNGHIPYSVFEAGLEELMRNCEPTWYMLGNYFQLWTSNDAWWYSMTPEEAEDFVKKLDIAHAEARKQGAIE